MQRHKMALTLCLGLAVLFVSNAALAQYQLKNLVSNQIKAAKFADPAASERLGPCSERGQPLLGQRSRLRLVDNLHWRRSQRGLGGFSSLV